jgi:hypothetical protein
MKKRAGRDCILSTHIKSYKKQARGGITPSLLALKPTKKRKHTQGSESLLASLVHPALALLYPVTC